MCNDKSLSNNQRQNKIMAYLNDRQINFIANESWNNFCCGPNGKSTMT